LAVPWNRANVKEQIILTDTVLVSKWVGIMADRPVGWFRTFAEVGASGVLNFMNVRNRTCGIMFNNQDATNQLPYGMRVMSIGVKFFSPACASQFTACNQGAEPLFLWTPKPETDFTDPPATDLLNREELHSAVWEADLPNNCSFMLRTNQDIRLEGPCAFFTPGYGPVGGGWGWGSPGTWHNAGETANPQIQCGNYVTNAQTIQHGDVDIRRRFPIPSVLELPKRANLAVEIRMSPYATDMLQAIPGPFWHDLPHSQGAVVEKRARAALFGVQVTIHGERLTPQRGDYSV
jgi:hypothetical protein